MKYFIIGDIHGMKNDLVSLYGKIIKMINDDDVIIFCGDYIDRGDDVFGSVEYLIEISKKHKTVFLTGNHETMLKNYLEGRDEQLYFYNGGRYTVQSYTDQFNSFYIPSEHRNILFSDTYYYETESFYAVHAGFNPELQDPRNSDVQDMVWIREKFIQNPRIWEKYIVFGHTPTHFMGLHKGEVFHDSIRKLIGIDTGAVYGGRLTCLVMNDLKIIQSIR